MWAMVRVIDQMSLPKQFLHFFGREAVSRLNCRAAGHRMQHVIQKIASGHLAIVLYQLFCKIFDDSSQITSRD